MLMGQAWGVCGGGFERWASGRALGNGDKSEGGGC